MSNCNQLNYARIQLLQPCFTAVLHSMYAHPIIHLEPQKATIVME